MKLLQVDCKTGGSWWYTVLQSGGRNKQIWLIFFSVPKTLVAPNPVTGQTGTTIASLCPHDIKSHPVSASILREQPPHLARFRLRRRGDAGGRFGFQLRPSTSQLTNNRTPGEWWAPSPRLVQQLVSPGMAKRAAPGLGSPQKGNVS